MKRKLLKKGNCGILSFYKGHRILKFLLYSVKKYKINLDLIEQQNMCACLGQAVAAVEVVQASVPGEVAHVRGLVLVTALLRGSILS